MSIWKKQVFKAFVIILKSWGQIRMLMLCNHCHFEWTAEEISRCPNCNSGNVGPHPEHYKIRKITS